MPKWKQSWRGEQHEALVCYPRSARTFEAFREGGAPPNGEGVGAPVAVAAARKEEGELRREHRTLTRAEWATITTLRPVVRRYPRPGCQPPGDRGSAPLFGMYYAPPLSPTL